MRFEKFTFYKEKEWIYLFPSIEIRKNAWEYGYPNIGICFHFLIWHFRWFWIDRKEWGDLEE